MQQRRRASEIISFTASFYNTSVVYIVSAIFDIIHGENAEECEANSIFW